MTNVTKGGPLSTLLWPFHVCFVLKEPEETAVISDMYCEMIKR